MKTNKPLPAATQKLSSQLSLPHGTAGCPALQLKAMKGDGEHLVSPPQLKPIQPYPKGALQGVGCCPVNMLDTR